jgi:DNA repair exonuclease SbcCD ATPase subunit
MQSEQQERAQLIIGLMELRQMLAQSDIFKEVHKQVETAIRQRTSQLEALREVSLEITSHLDLGDLLHSIVSRAAELVGARGVAC